MTDETSTPATTVCPVEDCHALIPDTIEDRRAHRRGHQHREKVDEAIRLALRTIRTDFDRLRGETRDSVKDIRDEVAGIDRAVGGIEIPKPVQPLTINRGSWDDDEDDDEPADEHDPWADLATPAAPEPGTVSVADLTGLPDDDEPDEDDLAAHDDDLDEIPVAPPRRF